MPKIKTKKAQRAQRQGLIAQYQANCERMQAMADLCETENRERTEAEEAEYKTLVRSNGLLDMKLRAMDAEGLRPAPAQDTDALLRECLLERGSKVTVVLTREDPAVTQSGLATALADYNEAAVPQGTDALSGTGIIPVYEQELLGPIRQGLIWDKVGLNIRSGLSGTLRWPKHTKAVASFADEKERLVDKSITFSSLDMTGKRMGIAIPVTREELQDSRGIVESVVTQEMPAAIVDLINDAMFCTSASYTEGGQSYTRKTYGPFVALASATGCASFTSATPTRAELLGMVAKVAAKVRLVAPCWVMTEATKFALCDVKVDSGSGRFVCEGDKILGYPVFCTSSIGEGNVGFGDWSYQAAGFFGDWSLIADPYTLARNNAVDFVLNARFGTVTLREDAFTLTKKHA